MRLGILFIVTSIGVTLAAGWFTVTRPVLSGAEPASSAPYMVEFDIPADVGSAPLNIVVEAPGRVWFTMPQANAIGSLVVTSTVDYHFTRYTVPTANSEPYDLAFAGNTVWFTQRAGNKIGRLNTLNGVITEYDVETEDSAPTGIDVAPDGQVWFVQRNGNKFARLDPASGSISEFLFPVAGAHFEQLVVQNNEFVWATSPSLDRLVAWEWLGGQPQFFNVGTGTGSQPSGIVMGGSAPWVTAMGTNLVGRYMPGTLTLWRWYPVNTPNSNLAGIAFRSESGLNRTWFAQRGANQVALLETDFNGGRRFYWELPLPTANGQPHGVTVDGGGTVWITAVGSHKIVQWRSPYLDVKQHYLPLVTKS
jgi:virginiamycin B lyase